jgi:hypothetical protein
MVLMSLHRPCSRFLGSHCVSCIGLLGPEDMQGSVTMAQAIWGSGTLEAKAPWEILSSRRLGFPGSVKADPAWLECGSQGLSSIFPRWRGTWPAMPGTCWVATAFCCLWDLMWPHLLVLSTIGLSPGSRMLQHLRSLGTPSPHPFKIYLGALWPKIFFVFLYYYHIVILGYIVTFRKVLTLYHSWIHPSILLLILFFF